MPLFVLLLFLVTLINPSLCTSEPIVIDSLTLHLSDSSDTPLDVTAGNRITRQSRTEKIGIQTENEISNKSNNECPGVVCFVKKVNNISTFDCRTNINESNSTSIIYINCTYWQKPQAINNKIISGTSWQHLSDADHYMNTDHSPDNLEPIRIRLRPHTEDEQLRISAQKAEAGALLRLCNAIRTNLNLESSLPLGISLMMLRIDKLDSSDLSEIFIDANVNNLILWNPIELAETTLLPPVDKLRKYENFIRITLHCEPENVRPAFTRLWIPWVKWSINFRHCGGQYTCYPWPESSQLCCQKNGCSKHPLYVITSEERETDDYSQSNSSHRSEQIVSYSNCKSEPTLSGPLADLKFSNNCWSSLRENIHEESAIITEIYSEVYTTVNKPDTESPVIASDAYLATSEDIKNSLINDSSSSLSEVELNNSTQHEAEVTIESLSNVTVLDKIDDEKGHGGNIFKESKNNEDSHIRILTSCVISLLVFNIIIFIGMFWLFCWMSRKWKLRKCDEEKYYWHQSDLKNNQESLSGFSNMSKIEDFPEDDIQNSTLLTNDPDHDLEIITRPTSHASLNFKKSGFDNEVFNNGGIAYTIKKAFAIQGRGYGNKHTLVMDATVDPQWLEPNLHPL